MVSAPSASASPSKPDRGCGDAASVSVSAAREEGASNWLPAPNRLLARETTELQFTRAKTTNRKHRYT